MKIYLPLKFYPYLLFIVLTSFYSTKICAQSVVKVEGTVLDSLKKPIEGVGIKLITDKDTLSTNSSASGYFSLPKVTGNRFYLALTALGYQSFVSVYEIQDHKKTIILDPILLKTETIQLKNVEIKAKADPIKIKKDTIEYNAAAYTIRKNDMVEDLLKQLQGIEVDKNGAVTAMGKKMTKLRVNGRDFFTSNVQDYIRKLPAYIVAKLQVIDDWGDQANFTGIRLGAPEKMLNLVTLPGMDKGLFGEYTAESSTNNKNSLQMNQNIWKQAKQIGLGGGLGITDNAVTKSSSTGLNGSLRNTLKNNLNYSIGYNQQHTADRSSQSTYLETFNPQGKIYDLSESRYDSKSINHSLNLQIDKVGKKDLFSVIATGNLGINNATAVNSSNKTGIIRQDLLSGSDSRNRTPTLNAAANWSRRFPKKGRSLSLGLNYQNSAGKTSNEINDMIRYYNESTNILVKDSLLNRLVEGNNATNSISGNIMLANSLTKEGDTTGNSQISLIYQFSISNSRNRQQTTANNQFQQAALVDSLGQDFESRFISHNLAVMFIRNKKNISYNAGINFSPVISLGKYNETGQEIRQSQFNYSPRANLSYQLKKNSSFSFNYDGNTQSPDFSKVQPVRNSSNIQNIVIGNPNLKATTTHNASLNYNTLNAKTGITIMMGLNTNVSRNSAISKTVFLKDTLNSLKQQTTYENVNGNYNIGGSYSVNKRMMTNKLSVSINGNVAYSHSVFFTDYVLNNSSGITVVTNVNSMFNLEKFSCNVAASHSFSSNTYAVMNQNIKNLQLLNLNSGGSWNPGRRLGMQFSASKSLNYGSDLGNSNPFLINFGLHTSFLKRDQLRLNIDATDLFNQGAAFRTTLNQNSISENRTRIISRIVQASLSYSLGHFGGED